MYSRLILRMVILMAMLVLSIVLAFAQTSEMPVAAVSAPIVDSITKVNGNTVTIPDALMRRLGREATPENQEMNEARNVSSARVAGYRIQVFSDSNAASARGEANSKASMISSRFSHMRTYVTYDSPYWRLKVGDFTTYEDASDALLQLKEAFPAFKREMRVVRDKINH